MKRLAVSTALVLATTLVAAIVYMRRGDLVLFALALVLTAAVHPLVDRLVRRGVPRGLAVGAVYVLGLVAFVTLIGVLGGPLVDELRGGIDACFATYESMHAHMPKAGGLQRVLARALPPAGEVFRGVGSSDPASWALDALGVTANAVSAVTQTLVVIVLSVYWAAADRAERRVGTRLWAALGFASLRTPWTRLLAHIGDHARVEIARIASYVVLLGLGYRLLDLKFWVLPAIAAAVLALIPFLGALLAILVAALAAIERGPLLCALAIAFTALVVLFVEAAIRRALRVKHTHPILLALIVLALASSAGLVSVLLAPPLAAAIEWLAAFLIDHNGRTELDVTVERVDARLQSLRARATHAGAGASASMAPLIERAARVTERVRRLAP